MFAVCVLAELNISELLQVLNIVELLQYSSLSAMVVTDSRCAENGLTLCHRYQGWHLKRDVLIFAVVVDGGCH